MLRSKKDDTFDYKVTHICKTCQNSFKGKYCNVCGEKIIEPSDKSIYNFLGSILNAFTFIDNKFLYTLRLMLIRTGYVSGQYIQGIRVPFIKPASMFFVVNLIYFLFPLSNTFNSDLETQMYDLPYSDTNREVVERKIERENMALEIFETKYNQQSTVMAKLLLIIFVVFMAVPLMILNFSKKRFFIDHLIVSLELNSILILMVSIITPWALYLLTYIFSSLSEFVGLLLSDDYYTIFGAAVCLFLFISVERRVYKQKFFWAVLKSILLLPCLMFVLQLYRVVLFHITMWTL